MMSGARVVVASRKRPARVHHRYADRVLVVRAGEGRNARIVCPGGVSPGQVLEINVEQQKFYVALPKGISPGQIFEVQIPESAPSEFRPSAAIVSDNHGEWLRVRYQHLKGAEKAWSQLSFLYASCLFVETKTGAFAVFKEYGTAKAVEQIKQKFYHEFKSELFPQFASSSAFNTNKNSPVIVQVHSVSQPSAPLDPASYESLASISSSPSF